MSLVFRVLGWPPDGPKLRLDYRRFRYAGKFVMSNTGKAVAYDADATSAEAVAAADTAESDVGVDADAADGEASADDVDGANADDGSGASADAFDPVLAAVAFNEDRTDPGAWWLRYITVRDDLRGDGLGARLAAFAAARLESRGASRVRIAVNNPFAYQALYKAGFGFTGEETGLAELVLERPWPRDAETYRAGLDRYRARDLSDAEASFLDSKAGASPPARLDAGP
ncbi:MAG: GNAT family N-acetyltransferase [Haloferacaceae archaeon]